MCLFDLGIVGIVLLGLEDGLAQDTIRQRVGLLHRSIAGEGVEMLLQGGSERCWRREQAFLEETVDELGSRHTGSLAGLFSTLTISGQRPVDGALFLGIGNRQCLQPTNGIERIAMRILQVRLQPSHHHL